MINQKLKDEIWNYCRLNDITNVDDFIERMVKQGYNIEKYGNAPIEPKVVEKIIEKEVEVIKEIPVDRIVEVEKEVIKEVYITDDDVVNGLQEKIKLLNKEILDLKSELDSRKPKPKKWEIKPPENERKSSINWVPKGGKDMYGDD